MLLSPSSLRPAVLPLLFACCISLNCSAVGNYVTNGGEYPINGDLPNDQVHPRLALSADGGYLVWEDAITDGEGLGISAVRLDSGFSRVLSPFRVNETGSDDQERPEVALLKDGGAVFVWQSGRLGFQHIYARFLRPDNTWLTGDVPVSSLNKESQLNSSVAILANGNVVVTWASVNEHSATSMQDVYAQILSPTGQKIGAQFRVNQFTAYNQRTPCLAALANGGFVIAWVSEMQRSGGVDNPDPNFVYGTFVKPSVDVYARLFNASGVPVGSEFLVNTSTRVCANPSLSAGAESGFIVAWGERDVEVLANSWDVFARSFSTAGVGSDVRRVNTQTYGEQFAPQVTAAVDGYFMVWNSLGQDGSMEGVYGQFINQDASPSGPELRINATTVSKQLHPMAASDATGRAVVVWTSFVGGTRSFDLFAQRFVDSSDPLPRLNAPFVHVPFNLLNGAYQPQIQVSWPAQTGLAIDHYEIYVNGAATPIASLTNTVWLMTPADGLKASTTVSFQAGYVTTDGRRSVLSPSSSATTWSGYNWGGLPFEWMTDQFGTDLSSWPAAGKELEPDGPTVLNVFLSGGDPQEPGTWLRSKLVPTSQGLFLHWNPKPGLLYQVQSSVDMHSWENVGEQRLASDSQDSLMVGYGTNDRYFRIVVLR